jgi:pimeloyl-ACP methyl ester carboxylesterase
MRTAFHRVDEFIRVNGPFHGIVGFSLGAAIAMSYILHQQRTTPDTKPSFYFAVLFSPIFVASSDDACYEGLITRLLDHAHAPFRSKFPSGEWRETLEGEGEEEEERTFAEYMRVVLSMHESVGDILPGNNTRFEFFDDSESSGGVKVGLENVPRLLHPVLTRERVRIPTVLVTGEKDVGAMAEQSQVAQGLCKASLQWKYRHDGGHDVPFKRSDVQAIVAFMREAAEEGRELRSLYDF